MGFLGEFKKDLQKSKIDIGSPEPPRYWIPTGNHVLNKIISGSFLRGIPQGRVVSFVGPSGSGKSFLTCNVIREALQKDVYVVVLDSEHALDEEFVRKIGINPKSDSYMYVEVDTIAQTRKIISTLIEKYNGEYGRDSSAPKLLIVLDSLDMLLTDAEEENFKKGETRGDMGSRNKQQKALLRELVHATKHLNISIVITGQVYRNQDILSGEGIWKINDAIQYALSLIVRMTKLKLKGEGREAAGIRMICEGYKTRFTKPFQTVTIEVPYYTGMDQYNGLLDVAAEMGVVNRTGGWYTLEGVNKKLRASDCTQYYPTILEKCEALRELYLDAVLKENEEIDIDSGISSRARRQEKVESMMSNENGNK
jgi:recombination protein RecA